MGPLVIGWNNRGNPEECLKGANDPRSRSIGDERLNHSDVRTHNALP
jgi:hypothetical protein